MTHNLPHEKMEMGGAIHQDRTGGNASPPHAPEGILPYSQSTVLGVGFSEISCMKMSILADCSLVGSGEAFMNCGSIFAVGCLNGAEHEGTTLDGIDFSGKAVVKYIKNSCHRPLCPKCWSSWANRECDNAKKRLDAFFLKNSRGKRMSPIHVIVSVPNADYCLSLPVLRARSYKALKRVGLLGGMLIYHPKRKNKAMGIWYFSPHFHALGFGWITDTRKNYISSGYVVKNVGVRKSIRGTIYYQLSHAGIMEHHHTVTWFGLLAYNKLKVPKIKNEAQICPLCGNELRRLLWVGKDVDFLGSLHKDVESGFYFEDIQNYVYKPRKVFSGDL